MYKNKVILATEKLKNTIFADKAIFLFNDNNAGSEGVILNPKIIGGVLFNIENKKFVIIENLDTDEFSDMITEYSDNVLKLLPLYEGGPISTDGIYLIHRHKELLQINHLKLAEKPWSNSINSVLDVQLFNEVYFGSPVTLSKILINKKDNSSVRFYDGQVAWNPWQLDEEIANGLWTVHEASSDLFFDMSAVKELNKPFVLDILQSPSKNFNPMWN